MLEELDEGQSLTEVRIYFQQLSKILIHFLIFFFI